MRAGTGTLGVNTEFGRELEPGIYGEGKNVVDDIRTRSKGFFDINLLDDDLQVPGS